jgi:hypothetical protein
MHGLSLGKLNHDMSIIVVKKRYDGSIAEEARLKFCQILSNAALCKVACRATRATYDLSISWWVRVCGRSQ